VRPFRWTGRSGASTPRKFLAGVVFLVTVGCQTNASSVQDVIDAEPSARTSLGDLIRYGNGLRTLDDQELDDQYRQFAAQRSDEAASAEAIKLALLLSSPDARFYDADQAVRLLDTVARRERARESGYGELAQLVFHLLSERSCSLAPEDESLTELLAAERERADRLGEELIAVKTELALSERQRETLQGQLDALKALEEQLSIEGESR
jgi:hypothetical protein